MWAERAKPLPHSRTWAEVLIVNRRAIITSSSECRWDFWLVIDPAPAAPPANEKEYPQANGCRCKANDQKNASNSTGVVEEPITHEYINIIHQSKGLTEKW
jgi:hypothetical protein